jgi:hypothetical protein
MWNEYALHYEARTRLVHIYSQKGWVGNPGNGGIIRYTHLGSESTNYAIVHVQYMTTYFLFVYGPILAGYLSKVVIANPGS